MADRRKIITLGFALALAVLAAVASAVWIAVLLFVLAAFLIAWGLEPRRTEVYVGRLPYGNYLLKVLAKLDLILSRPELRARHAPRVAPIPHLFNASGETFPMPDHALNSVARPAFLTSFVRTGSLRAQ